MKKLLLSIYCLMLVVLTACEKEIDMDYRQVSPKYVAEAMMTQDNTTVFLAEGTCHHKCNHLYLPKQQENGRAETYQ